MTREVFEVPVATFELLAVNRDASEMLVSDGELNEVLLV